MASGAQLTVTDLRRAARHPVDHKVIGEHRRLGDLHLHVVNISAHGFMTEGQLIRDAGKLAGDDDCGFGPRHGCRNQG